MARKHRFVGALFHFWGSLAAAFLIFLFIAFEAYTLIIQFIDGAKALPPTFGNFPRNREKLANEKLRDEFSFAVVGDLHSRGTFAKIAEQLRGEPISFAVLVGDGVHKATESYHKHFRAEWTGGYALDFSVFYVVGNHDVDQQHFPLSRFEQLYGPSIFSFEYQNCLFVVLRILNKFYTNEESHQFLQKLIAEDAASQYRKIFVFMHIPPPISPDFRARRFEGENELISQLNELKPDYVFAGDYHGYARIKVKDTVYLISGGGGGHLVASKFGKFCHAMILRIGGDYVSERILYVKRASDLKHRLKRFALARFQPWLSRNQFIAAALNFLLLACLAGICRHLYKHFRTAKFKTAEST